MFSTLGPGATNLLTGVADAYSITLAGVSTGQAYVAAIKSPTSTLM